MRSVWGITFLLWASVGLCVGPRQVYAQACKDETSMVEGSRQNLAGFTAEVSSGAGVDEGAGHWRSDQRGVDRVSPAVGDRTGSLE